MCKIPYFSVLNIISFTVIFLKCLSGFANTYLNSLLQLPNKVNACVQSKSLFVTLICFVSITKRLQPKFYILLIT